MPDFQPFAHLTTPNADLYRAVMGAFVRAKRRFVVHLRPEDVHEELDGDLAAVTDALGRLKDWGNLRADPDTSRVTTVEDLRRRRTGGADERRTGRPPDQHRLAVATAVATCRERPGRPGDRP